MALIKGFTVQINTGRMYTDAGQPIDISYDAATNSAVFCDRARMIAGRVDNVALAPDEIYESQADLTRAILAAYDCGRYTNI